jgi:hypothetical protein
VNTRVAYWSKTGQPIWGPTQFSTFFSIPANSFVFDPHALYDPTAGRFYMVALESDNVNQQSFLHIAVSKSSNPASGTAADWYFYQIENTRTVNGTAFWGDYPGFGFDGQAVYVTVNMYDFSGFLTGDAQITVLDKSALLSGGTNYLFIYPPGGQAGAFTLQPCTVIGASDPGNVAYFGETFPNRDNTSVRVWALTDPLGAGTLKSALVTIPDNGGTPPFSGAPQPGTSLTVDTLDGRTQGNAFWNSRAIWFCHTAAGHSGRSSVYYYKVDVSSFPASQPTLAQSGSVDGGPGIWTYQPSIGGNSFGDVCMVYTESAASTTYPTIMYTVQLMSEAAFEPSGVLKVSPTFSNSDRWGDFGSVSADPVDQTFWVTHEWARSAALHDWSTWWGNLLPWQAPAITAGPTPTNLTVLAGLPAGFSVTTLGTPPFQYQWRFNGVSISGATDSAFSIAAAQVTDAGTYSVTVTNRGGSVTSSAAILTVIPTVPLPFALNNSNLLWSSDITSPWYGQTNVSHDGVASAKSYFIQDNQQTVLNTTTNGPGKLTFWWKVSSQTNADILSFVASGGGLVDSRQISGEVDWNQQTIFLPSGSQTFQWTYTKDAAKSAGSDAGWVDQVGYVPGVTLPFIISQPLGKSSFAGSPVTFTVAANGTPALSYQWRLNGKDIPGATSTSFAIANPTVLDSGLYSVRVTNSFGGINSANASLAIVPLVVRGDNAFGQVNVSLNTATAVGIAAGAWHSLILLSDGSILANGEDYDGQCEVPGGLKNVMTVAAGGYHSLALKFDGTITGWGANYNGEAAPPAGLSNVIAIAAGTWHSLALRADGTVVAWGDNSLGQCSVPSGLVNVTAIAAGGSHSLALRADGVVVAWGENTDAEGNFIGQSTVPFGLANVVAIGAGDYHSLAVKADGSIVTWGDDSQGQLDVPPGLSHAVAVAGGSGHTLALKADGTVAAWGNDWNGQIDLPASLSNVVAIAAGNAHTLLLEGNNLALPQLLRPAHLGNQFRIVLQTFAGKTYALEYKTSLSDSTWSPATTIRGNGAMQFLLDPNAAGPRRFYRIREY